MEYTDNTLSECPPSFGRTEKWLKQDLTIPLQIGLGERNLNTRLKSAGSFDSQDCQTFRIAAQHEVTIGPAENRDSKMKMAAVLEHCTKMMKGMLIPKSKKPVMPRAVSEALQNCGMRDATSTVMETVAAQVEAKSLDSLHGAIFDMQQIAHQREGELEVLKAIDRRDPEVIRLSEEKERLTDQIEMCRAETSILEGDHAATASETNLLRRLWTELRKKVGHLKEAKEKYRAVAKDNKLLNRSIQQLQGAVRVICSLPSNKSTVYLETKNRGEITFKGKKKHRTFGVDSIICSNKNAGSALKPLLVSALDGMDVMVVSIGDDDITRFCDVLNKSLELLCELTNDQAHLASRSIELEISAITSREMHTVTPRTRFMDKPSFSLETVSSIVKSKEYFKKAHLVVTAYITTSAEDQTYISSLTFIQIDSDIVDMDEVGSTFRDLSARKSVPHFGNLSTLEKLINTETTNDRVVAMILEMQDAAGNQKKDLELLALSSKIMDARIEAFNAEAADRYQEAMRLKKELALKDIKISELETIRSELKSQSKSLNQEIEHLQSEIRALKKMRDKKMSLDKKLHSIPEH